MRTRGKKSQEKGVIIVAKSKIVDKKTNKERLCKYSDVPTDDCKWVNDLTYMPIPFDLMFVRLDGSGRVKSAWWNGRRWKGLRLKKEESVVAWKRNYDYI